MSSIDLWLPCPSEPSGLTRWGDYHFALALAQAFEQAGLPVRLLYRDTYRDCSSSSPSTALLVIRGKYQPAPSWLASANYRQRLLWVISWPSTITTSELSNYSLAFVASQHDLPRISSLTSIPCYELRQATSFYHYGKPTPPRGGLLFAANCRGEPRPLAAAFLRSGIKLRLIGDGWQQCGLTPWRTQMANACLPALYRSSLALLNDHHPDMLTHGYQSNRLFDALACAVPVISDSLLDCPPELMCAVVPYTPGCDPCDLVDQVFQLRCNDDMMADIAQTVHHHHSFRARVSTIIAALQSVA